MPCLHELFVSRLYGSDAHLCFAAAVQVRIGAFDTHVRKPKTRLLRQRIS